MTSNSPPKVNVALLWSFSQTCEILRSPLFIPQEYHCLEQVLQPRVPLFGSGVILK